MSEKANSGPEHTVRNPGIERIATVAVDTAPFSVSVAGKDLFQASSKVFASVLIRELILRLPLLSALMAVFVVGLAFFGDMDGRNLGLCWLVVMFMQLCLYYLLLRARTLGSIYSYALAIVSVGILWWMLLPVFNVDSGPLTELSLLSYILLVGSVPWARKYNLILVGIFAVVVTVYTPFSSIPVLFVSAGVLVLLLFVRSAANNYLDLMSKTELPLMVRACESFTSGMATVRLLGWHLGLVGDVDSILLIHGSDEAEVLGRGAVKPSSADPVYVRGLLKVLTDSQLNYGMIGGSELGSRFLTAFLDWFGFSPSAIIFCQLPLVVQEREEVVYLIVPLTEGVRFVGVKRLYNVLLGMCSVVRMALSATRRRFLSSDVLLSAERTLAEREQEISDLVHLVNNSAQDLAINLESLNALVAENRHSDAAALRIEVARAEAAVKALSTSVSDLKWLKELQRAQVSGVAEAVPLALLVEELSQYVRYRGERRGYQVEIHGDLDERDCVEVVSREFLGACLRALVQVCEFRVGRAVSDIDEWQALLRFSTTCKDGKLDLVLSDTASPYPEGEFANLILGTASVIPDAERDGLLATHQLALVSHGTFAVGEGDAPCRSSLVLSLPYVKRSPLEVKSGAGWILLVDDKPEIVTFYARVAQALKLECATAQSVEEAVGQLDQRGCPCMVITDIQLSNSSGLDLVRHLRSEFGQDLPVIVVSGNTDSDLSEQVHAAGGTSFLAKPVGRKRLFLEINRLLGGATD